MFKLLFIFIFASLAQAQSIESFDKEIELASDSKKMAQETALKELSRELVQEIVGESQFARDKEKIEKAIIQNHNRYVLSVTSSKGELGEGGKFLFKVHIKVSKDNLKALLLEHKLFYISEGSFCALPLLSFSLDFDGKKESYSWWLKRNKPSEKLEKMARGFFDSLSRSFIKIGFFAIDPAFQRSFKGIPSSILPRRGKSLKNFVRLSQFYSCDIILSGNIHLGKSLGRAFSFAHILSSDKSQNSFQSKDSYWTQFAINAINIKTYQYLFRLKKQFPFDETLVSQPEKSWRAAPQRF